MLGRWSAGKPGNALRNQHEGVLQENGRAQGRNHSRKPRRLPQWLVGGSLQNHSQKSHRRHHHHTQGGKAEHGAEMGDEPETGYQRQPQISAGTKKVAVGKVDQLEHAIDHGVPQSDQGINATHRQARLLVAEKTDPWLILPLQAA